MEINCSNDLVSGDVSRNVYFVFEYYHDKKYSALIPFVSDMKKIRELDGFQNVDLEGSNQCEIVTQRCFEALVATGTKEVFSVRCRNSMSDTFLGFLLHYSEGDGRYFFHYDFVNPQTEGYRFKKIGIELKEFKRE